MNNKGNLGLKFNKLYYKNKDSTDDIDMIKAGQNEGNTSKSIKRKIKDKNKELLDYIVKFNVNDNISKPWTHTIRCKILYPGLIIGSGLQHGIGLECEFKNGFQMDYTTGLPIIPGSSVKGVIKSFFKELIKSKSNIEFINDNFGTNYKLDEMIETKKNLFNEVALKIPNVFFDAEIISEGKILASDFITPHKKTLENPIPIKFLKIKPNTEIEFRFKLVDDKYLLADEKLVLIKEILLLTGVGAKTNVGYGHFDREYTNKYLSKKIRKAEEEAKRKAEKEHEKKLKKLSGFSKEKYLFQFYEKKSNKQEKIERLVKIFKELDSFENKISVAKFLKKELKKVKKWNKWKNSKFENKRNRYAIIQGIIDERN